MTAPAKQRDTTRLTADEVIQHLKTNSRHWQVRAAFYHECARLEQADAQRRPVNPIMRRGEELMAAKRIVAIVVDEGIIARAICQSGKFETGEGTCAFTCMARAGDPRKEGCPRASDVHAKLAAKIAEALRL